METGPGPLTTRDTQKEYKDLMNAAYELANNEEQYNKRKEIHKKNVLNRANDEWESAIDYDRVFLQAVVLKHRDKYDNLNIVDFFNKF